MAATKAGRSLDVLLAEFNAARTEIDRKNSARLTLISLHMTAVAAIAGLVLTRQADPRLLIVLPGVCTALGFTLLSESRDKALRAKYIDDVLRPLIIEATGDDRLLAWESYYDRGASSSYLVRVISTGLLFPGVALIALIASLPSVASVGDWIAWSVGLALEMVLIGAGIPRVTRIREASISLAQRRRNPDTPDRPIRSLSIRDRADIKTGAPGEPELDRAVVIPEQRAPVR
jgi:hypothetical protein